MKRFFILFVVLILASSACSHSKHKKDKEERTAEQLVAAGMDSFNRGKYTDAIDAFEKLRDWYPFSKYAILAELKVADASFKKELYQEAANAYEQFEGLHPRNEAVPYVIYQAGMCYFLEMSSPDRDLTQAQKALECFQRLIQQHPDSPYARQASEKAKVCARNLSEHEFIVGKFYYKNKKYQAAMERFQNIVESFPDTGMHFKALEYMALCKEKIKD